MIQGLNNNLNYKMADFAQFQRNTPLTNSNTPSALGLNNPIPEGQGVNGNVVNNANNDTEKNNSKGRFDKNECQTCKSRKYKDGSDDPGVSFKTPTKIAPQNAASAVASHEQEHVVREQAKANREGREVVSQSVSIHTAICPECGKPYVSGGTTRTTTKGKSNIVEYSDEKKNIGKNLNIVA